MLLRCGIAWDRFTICPPFGEILAACEDQETIVYADQDPQSIEERRLNMPVRNEKILRQLSVLIYPFSVDKSHWICTIDRSTSLALGSER